MPADPADQLLGFPTQANATVLDFWRWAFADLSDDDVKGFFAEWMLHKLLDVPTRRRVSWANSDIITPNGTRIEVKSTAYWQSWKYVGENGLPLAQPSHLPTDDDSKIRFAGLRARDSTTTDRSTSREFKSDFYVFAFQHEKDLAKWNALDLNQWEFYWVPANTLRELGWSSVSLRTLRQRFSALSAAQLATTGRASLAEFERHGDA